MTEVLLVLAAVAAVTVGVLAAMALVLAAIRRVTAYFVLPVEPPGLLRLRRLVERQLAERRAADEAAGHHYPPPPAIFTTLRKIAGSGG